MGFKYTQLKPSSFMYPAFAATPSSVPPRRERDVSPRYSSSSPEPGMKPSAEAKLSGKML